MKLIVLIAVLGLVLWQGVSRYIHNRAAAAANAAAESGDPLPPFVPNDVPASKQSGAFQCDNRTHCSQMRSCAEATYFLKNCPGVQMDGDNDGIPCEQQWC
jgi:Excalibur calcium-binding domain